MVLFCNLSFIFKFKRVMKKKNFYSFNDMPNEVLFLKMATFYGWPVGVSFYDKTIRKYPEHFPKEFERMIKWDAIPKEVHDAYIKELMEFREDLWKGEPKSGGIMSAVDGDYTYKKFSEAFDRLWPIEEEKEKELHKKYYSKYGI